MIGAALQRIERLRGEAARQERDGSAVCEIKTAFPKNPPKPGIAYSRNFARYQQAGRFAVQEKG